MGRGGRDRAQTSVAAPRRSDYGQEVLTENLDNGRIIVVESNQDLKEALRRWKALGPQTIALDLECAASPTVPNGSGLHPHLGTIRLMQLAVTDGGDGNPEALVIDARKIDMREAMKIVEDPSWPTLVHYAQMETRWLGYTQGSEIGGLIDTCRASQLIDDEAESHSLGNVVKRQLGTELSKEQQNSYWDAVELSEEQLEYAGKDVLSLLDVWKQMEDRLSGDDLKDLKDHADTLNEKSLRVSESGPKGCESDRALNMVRACRSESELDRLVEQGLPHMRLHHSNQDRLGRAVRRARKRLADGAGPKRPVKVKVASWRQPF